MHKLFLFVSVSRMSQSRGDFGYGSLSSTEFNDHRSLVGRPTPRGKCCLTFSTNEMFLCRCDVRNVGLIDVCNASYLLC